MRTTTPHNFSSRSIPLSVGGGSAGASIAQPGIIILFFLGLIGAVGAAQSPAISRLLFTLSVAIILIFLLLKTPRIGVPTVFIYLSFLGGVRHWLIPVVGWSAFDPLLLVGPAVCIFYFINLLFAHQVRRDTKIARLIFWLLILMTLQVFNPLQGGILVGVAGAMFYIVPVLWYFVGRTKGSVAVLQSLLPVIAALSCLGSLYGLYQQYIGFAASELEWLRISGYTQLVDKDMYRPFSFYSSSSEYVLCLGLGIIALWAAWLRGNRLVIVPLLLLVAAAFLSSVRSAVVMTLVSCIIMWAVQGRSSRVWGPRLLLAVLVGGFGLNWSLNQAQQATFDPRVARFAQHQIKGLQDPLGSTGVSHFTSITGGILGSFAYPMGRGLGITTIAALRFGTDAGYNTEYDISNIFVSLGVVGGLIYVYFIYTVLKTAFQLWQRTRSVLILTILGVLIAEVGFWASGQHYMASPFVWFCIGALDHNQREVTASDEAALLARYGQFPLPQTT